MDFRKKAQKLFNEAKIGTVISVTHHATGDYAGHYTKVSKTTWKGKERFPAGAVVYPELHEKGFINVIGGQEIKIVG